MNGKGNAVIPKVFGAEDYESGILDSFAVIKLKNSYSVIGDDSSEVRL